MAKLENPDAIARLRRTERAKSCRYVSSRTRVPDNDTLVRKRTQEDPIRPSECLPTSTKARGTGPSSDRGRQSSASCGSANPWSRRDVPCSGSHHVVLAPSHDVTSPAERRDHVIWTVSSSNAPDKQQHPIPPTDTSPSDLVRRLRREVRIRWELPISPSTVSSGTTETGVRDEGSAHFCGDGFH